jgi:hypothetical protein
MTNNEDKDTLKKLGLNLLAITGIMIALIIIANMVA